MTIILQILGIAVGLGLLIFIHELGHFLAAKMCKVKVLTFAFGFGPDLLKYNHNGTKYCIKAIPFGGFVAMAGDEPEKATGAQGEYLSLPWFKKIWIAFSGPFSNYILAVIIFAVIFNIWGVSKVSTFSEVGSTVADYPAAAAGLLKGDKIVSIDGVQIKTWNELSDNLKDKAEKETAFIIERGSYTFDLNMAVAKNPVTGMGAIGISPAIVKADAGFFESFALGAEAAVVQTVMTVAYLLDKLISWEKPDVAGPIGVMQVMANATKSGAEDYLKLLAVISVALGMFNLFPIPLVDGGMIVLFVIEGITRKKISPKVVQAYNTVGIFLILLIFIFATYSDLLRLGVGKFFTK